MARSMSSRPSSTNFLRLRKGGPHAADDGPIGAGLDRRAGGSWGSDGDPGGSGTDGHRCGVNSSPGGGAPVRRSCAPRIERPTSGAVAPGQPSAMDAIAEAPGAPLLGLVSPEEPAPGGVEVDQLGIAVG